MHSLKRGALVAVVAATLTTLAPAAANAWISPDPYATSAGTGVVWLEGPLGIATCNLTAVVASATGTPTGATGTISGFTATGCRGVITAARFGGPMTFAVVNGAVRVDFSILKTTILGARCLYRGPTTGFTGTMVNGATSFTVRGTKYLDVILGGVCTNSQPTTLTIDLPGGGIGW